MCATGTEALRGAAYAVAAGAVDIALAIGAEKLKDTGYGGLPVPTKGTLNDLCMPYGSAPGRIRAARGGLSRQVRRVEGGPQARDRARLVEEPSERREEPEGAPAEGSRLDTILNAPMIADPLGLFDCCGVSDGAACAIVTTPEIARGLGKKDLVTIKALQLSLSAGREIGTNGLGRQLRAQHAQRSARRRTRRPASPTRARS